MVAVVGVAGFVVGPAGNQSDRPAGAVDVQIHRPGVGHRLAVPDAAGGEDLGQFRLRHAAAVEDIAVDYGPVGPVQLPVPHVAVVDAVEVARMMLGRDEVNAVDPVGG